MCVVCVVCVCVRMCVLFMALYANIVIFGDLLCILCCTLQTSCRGFQYIECDLSVLFLLDCNSVTESILLYVWYLSVLHACMTYMRMDVYAVSAPPSLLAGSEPHRSADERARLQLCPLCLCMSCVCVCVRVVCVCVHDSGHKIDDRIKIMHDIKRCSHTRTYHEGQ